MSLSDTLSNEELWAMMPGPKRARIVYVNNKAGCPVCGKSGGWAHEGAWSCDVLATPWKVKCGVLLPKNDFGKYYRSGLNKHGEFDPQLSGQDPAGDALASAKRHDRTLDGVCHIDGGTRISPHLWVS